MLNTTADLSSLSFESGLPEGDRDLVHLRARAAGLTFCRCAHAVFLCKLAHSLRCRMNSEPAGDSGLRVGILGLGHVGKQLLHALLQKTDIRPSHIKISTRRPESAVRFTETGVECFYDSGRLAAWADILFLCCLPSHLPRVCAGLQSHLSKHCLVYSFISAVPVTRLARLLGHDFILKPQYDFVAPDTVNVWLSCTCRFLNDPALIEESCPLTMSGGISLGLEWLCAVLYSLLNVCTSAGVVSGDALALISSVLGEKCPHTVKLNTQNFIGASCALTLLTEKPFPWISLIDVQTKESPLLCFLSSSKSLQQSLSAVYTSLLLETATHSQRT